MATKPTPAETAQFSEDLADDVWAYDDLAGPSLRARFAAEAIGTFLLVLIGLGAAFAAGFGSNGTLTVGLGFGIAALGAIVAFGHVSGAHLNPAVTLGLWAAGRFPAKDIAPYILAQVAGAIIAGGVLFGIAGARAGSDAAAGMNSISIGWGEHSPGGFEMWPGIIAEIVATALLVGAILAATSVKAPKGQAPFTIALSLTMLVVITIPFTNGALNPARATGTALFADSWAVTQLWAWWIAPIVGAVIMGLLVRTFGPEDDIETVEVLEVIAD